MIKYAWHYTTTEKFELIIKSGLLKTTLSLMPERRGERPIVWFTINQEWEPTTAYTYRDNKPLTMLENKQAGGGLVRLGYPLAGIPNYELIPWIELYKVAGIKPKFKNLLEKLGKNRGSNPYHWLGCFNDIPLESLIIQKMNDLNQWESAELSTFRVLTEEQVIQRRLKFGY